MSVSVLHDARSSGHWDSATRRFWLTVVAVGLIGGVTGAAYVETLHLVTNLLGPRHWGRDTHLLLLGVVGAAIGILTLTLGNPGDVELLVDNIHVQGGSSDLRALRALIPISLLGIGAGSAIGPEAPLVQTTGSLGSWVGRRWNIPLPRSRWLTITGMAAGFTVLFGAPLGSAIFALEILHRDGLEYYEALLPAAVGSTMGYGIYATVTKLGLSPIWHFPSVRTLKPIDMVVGLGAGIVGAIIAYAFTYLSVLFRRGFRVLPVAARPIAGGLALGGLAWLSPYALTYGEGQIQTIVNGRLLVTTLIVAGLAKLLASSCIVSSGWRGGFIIPLFFMGAAFGAAGAHFTGVNAAVAMLSLMVAANVGVTKTPLGSCLIVVEMAGVRMLPPILLAALVAFFLTRQVDMIHTQRDREGAFDAGAGG